MNYDDWLAEQEANDPGFREAREKMRPRFEFRKALIGARLARGWTQKELAERMVTKQSAIARLERGTQIPTVDTLYRLAAALGVDFTITPQEPLTVRPHKAA